jgi:hypothetical protein
LMKVPPGVSGWEGKVLKLMTSLYGLPTAHKYWDEHLKAILLGMGFTPSPADPKLYSLRRMNKNGHEEMFDIPLYVDDMPVHWRGRELRDWVLAALEDKGLILKVGPLEKVLGMTVTTDWQEGVITMSQRPAKEFLLEISGHTQKKKRTTPMKVGLVLDKVLTPSTLEDRLALKDFEYRTFVGKIGDMCMRTCPQYMLAFSNLSRHVNDPRKKHRDAMEWLLDYMMDDLDTKLVYRRHSPAKMACKIVHFSDSSFADDKIDAKSQGCGLGFVYGNLVWWVSRRQSSIATSTFMAETMSRFESGTEIAHQRELLAGLGDPETGPSLIWQDNIASLYCMYTDGGKFDAKKHMLVKYLWAREAVSEGTLLGAKICTTRNLADVGTKNQHGPLFQSMIDVMLGITFIPEILGVRVGDLPAKTVPFKINDPEQGQDPTLRYMLASDRHTEVYLKLPKAIQGLFLTGEENEF